MPKRIPEERRYVVLRFAEHRLDGLTDEPRPGLSQEEALREAPEVIEDKFAVPKFD